VLPQPDIYPLKLTTLVDWNDEQLRQKGLLKACLAKLIIVTSFFDIVYRLGLARRKDDILNENQCGAIYQPAQ
jgi:hypothetical protein